MEEKDMRLSRWDYMWQDKVGHKFVGAVLYPGKRKREGRYLWEMKKKIVDAYKSQEFVSMTILHNDSFLDIEARIWDVVEEKNRVTVRDASGTYYFIQMKDVLHIEKQHDEHPNE